MALDFSGWNTLGQGLNQAIGSFADLAGLSGKAQALADLRATLNGQSAPQTPFQTLGGMLKNGWNDITGQSGATDGKAIAGQTLASLSAPATAPPQTGSIPKPGYGSNGLPDATNEGLLRQRINPYGNDQVAGGQLPGGGTFGQRFDQATATPGLSGGAFSDAYAKRLAQIESSGNPNAYNKDSGASGLYQFVPKTAAQYGLTNPQDPNAATAAVAQLTNDNAAALRQALGRDPTPGELYLAHQQGATGAARLLANPDAPAASIVGQKAVVQNGGTPNMTAGQFASLWVNKFEGGNGAAPVAGGQVDATGAIPAAPAAPAQQSVGANIPTEALLRLFTNPNLPSEDKALIGNLLQMRMPQPKQFGFQVGPDGTLYRTNATTGEAGIAAQGGPKPTTDMQDYQQAVKQGFQGSLYDYQRGLKTAGAQVIQVGSGEKSYDQKQGEQLAADMGSYQKDAGAAQSQLNTYGAMQKAAADPNFYAGLGGRYKAVVDKAWTLIGGDPKTPASNETFGALASRSVLDSLGGSLGPGVSNGDRDFIEASAPNLDMSPQGIKNLIDIQTKIAQRKIEVAKMARQYAAGHGGRLDYGFQDVVGEFAAKNPLFPQAAQSGAPAAPAPAPGTIDGGYKFKGGDPADSSNWELVK